MFSSFIPPRRVKIGDAAAFAGTTPRAIRHYHSIGLLPEPERGSDDRRRYDYDDMIRLLWIRSISDTGIALADIRAAFTDTAPAAAGDDDHGVDGVLERLDENLAAQEAQLQRRRSAVERMRTRGSRLGLLDDVVARRLEGLPEGSVRQDDLDTLLLTERIFGPLGAAVQAGRFVILATRPELREQSDRVDAAEEALDDTVAVDDPRVAQAAAQRHAFEEALNAVIEASGQAEEDDALFDAWDELHPVSVRGAAEKGRSLVDAVGMMPYDFSPARLRCMELTLELAAAESGTPA